MIKGRLIHPDILRGLAGAGHGSTVLVCDAHYPAGTATGPNADVVHLNLEAMRPTVPEVLAVLLDTVHVETVTLMEPSADALPSAVQQEVGALLPDGVASELVDRFDFYRLARSEDLALVVVTGDTRRFGNVLLTVGVLPD